MKSQAFIDFFKINRLNEKTLVQYDKVKVAQSCPTLCDPVDYTGHGILQARTQECVAIPFSRGSSQPRDRGQVPCTAGWFFTSWAAREALQYDKGIFNISFPCLKK